MGLKWRQDEMQLVTIVVLLESKVGLMERKKRRRCAEREVGNAGALRELLRQASGGLIGWWICESDDISCSFLCLAGFYVVLMGCLQDCFEED